MIPEYSCLYWFLDHFTSSEMIMLEYLRVVVIDNSHISVFFLKVHFTSCLLHHPYTTVRVEQCFLEWQLEREKSVCSTSEIEHHLFSHISRQCDLHIAEWWSVAPMFTNPLCWPCPVTSTTKSEVCECSSIYWWSEYWRGTCNVIVYKSVVQWQI